MRKFLSTFATGILLSLIFIPNVLAEDFYTLEIFTKLDIDKSGLVDRVELQRYFDKNLLSDFKRDLSIEGSEASIRDTWIKEILTRADSNKDSRLELSEFLAGDPYCDLIVPFDRDDSTAQCKGSYCHCRRKDNKADK
jgi:hypothetical protein